MTPTVPPAPQTAPDVTELSLDEKSRLLVGRDFWHTHAVGPADHPVVRSLTLADGPHGVRKQPDEGDHLGIGDAIPATCFPPAVTLGSTWDAALVREVGQALGSEARALGVDVLLGPGVNIKRSPLGGRNFEYLSEDPVVAGDLGAQLIAGIQSRGVAASLKHFAANNQESDRMRVSAEVDERTLREIYLEVFRRAVVQGRPWTVMAAYNRINGVFAGEHEWLLTRVLREEWGFDGVVVSDWGGVSDRVASLRAGLDLQMPGPVDASVDDIRRAVAAGDLGIDVLDASASRLELLSRRTTATQPAPPVDADAHHALARRAALEGIVLAKNDTVDGTPLLPLSDTDPNLLIIGELARAPRVQGAGSSQVVPTRHETPWTEIRRIAAHATYAAGYALDGESSGLADAAVTAAASARTAVVFLGLPAKAESEGYDRSHLRLPTEQVDLVRRVAEVCPRTVVVLQNGAPVDLRQWEAVVPAIFAMGLAGQAGGSAVAQLLFGHAEPSGRLTETIPLRLEDTPAFLNFPGENGVVRYGEGVFVGYRHHDLVSSAVGYPFGHGLTYTRFAYADADAVRHGDVVQISVSLTNVGDRPGSEVVQVYVEPPEAAVRRPVRELRAFSRVTLRPGESARVRFVLSRRDFSYWDTRTHDWRADAGTATVWFAASSRDLRTCAHVDIPEETDAQTRDLTEWATLGEALRHPVVGARLRAEVASGTFHPMSEDLERMAGDMPLRLIADFEGMLFDRAQLADLLSGVATPR